MQKHGAAQNGPTLLDVFFEQRSRLIGLAAKIIGCRSHAEDIVHEAFMKVDDAAEAEQIHSQASYLTRVVRNLSIDHYRRRQFEERLMRQDVDSCESPVMLGESPEALVSDQQVLERVSGALADLPERTRDAFEMCRIHGMTQREIAKILGVSPSLVNAMIRDALQHCREKAL
ncbi:RNA polymerase factor sigma-70 [Pseudomonas sp. NPDC089396]|jgi:RNA polymerase sigma-70 factor (ECF subfamily)|uniref:RNA polymerase factor sigma-70 n=1 Tax=Pseudomonas sp. NPDC089396 TaxID=3364461 RepID=UPI003832A52D